MYRDLIISFRTQHIDRITAFRSLYSIHIFNRLQVIIGKPESADHLDVHHIPVIEISVP